MGITLALQLLNYPCATTPRYCREPLNNMETSLPISLFSHSVSRLFLMYIFRLSYIDIMHIYVHLLKSHIIILSEATYLYTINLTLCHRQRPFPYFLFLFLIRFLICSNHSLIVPLTYYITPTVLFLSCTSCRSHRHFPTDWSLPQGIHSLMIQVLSCTVQHNRLSIGISGLQNPTCLREYLRTAEPVSFPPPAMSPRLTRDQQARRTESLSLVLAPGVDPDG